MAKGDISEKRRGAGRPPGAKNKIPALIKDAVVQAAISAGEDLDPKTRDGLVSYLKAQAVSNPGPFMALMGKVLPTQLEGTDNPLKVVTRVERVIVGVLDGAEFPMTLCESPKTTPH